MSLIEASRTWCVARMTYIYRLTHIDNLPLLLRRLHLHAPNFAPEDGFVYRTIHNIDIQKSRRVRRLSCGPGGVLHDYVPFYFGVCSPMLLKLHTGQVAGYTEGQDPLIYLVSTAEGIRDAGIGYVFSDGHGIAAFTSWYADLADLNKVDWEIVRARYWSDTEDDLDRKRRKQAEFLVHRACPWSLIRGVAVRTPEMQQRVEVIFGHFPTETRRPVAVRSRWYY